MLLKLYAKIVDHEMPYVWDESFWVLTIDGQMFLDEASLVDPLSSQYTFGSVMESFPDNCLVVNGGHTLGISKHPDIDRVHMALIGYFCDMP